MGVPFTTAGAHDLTEDGKQEGSMQISDYSSLSEYYAELAKLRSQNANRSAASEIFGQDSDSGGRVNASSAFASMFSQVQASGTTGTEGNSPPPPPISTEKTGQSDTNNNSSKDLLTILEKSSGYGNALDNSDRSSSSSTASMFAELLKNLGSGGASSTGYSQYIQNIIKSAYES